MSDASAPSALIGHTGFVGTTLRRQRQFDATFNSSNIASIDGARFGHVICCAAPAQKWRANSEPDADRRTIESLQEHLRTICCDRFVLISTVDVFGTPVAVDEDTFVDDTGLHPYGLHRLLLERFVRETFARHLVVRLPGLVGPGLRKNVVFDFLNGGSLAGVDGRSVFQFYPMVNLWSDLSTALDAGLSLVHLTSAPISVADVARCGFGRMFDQVSATPPVAYDMRSRHAALFGGIGHYQYSYRESVQALRAYAQSEPRTLREAGRPVA